MFFYHALHWYVIYTWIQLKIQKSILDIIKLSPYASVTYNEAVHIIAFVQYAFQLYVMDLLII